MWWVWGEGGGAEARSLICATEAGGRVKRPVWAPSHLLTSHLFAPLFRSTQWSFGIVLYEIFQFGKIPYPGMSNREVYERVVQGYRMKKPKSCPDVIYDLMASCWDDTSHRPSFRDIEKV